MSKPITHKPFPECPMTGPHDPALCGLVKARRARSATMQAAIERQLEAERERQERRER